MTNYTQIGEEKGQSVGMQRVCLAHRKIRTIPAIGPSVR
jgi:hypothetical protein